MASTDASNHDSLWAAAIGFLGLIVAAAWTRVGMLVGWKHDVDYRVKDLELGRTDIDRQISLGKEYNEAQFAHIRGEMRRGMGEVRDKLDKTHDLALKADAKLDILIRGLPKE
jgi:hypothetical protein